MVEDDLTVIGWTTAFDEFTEEEVDELNYAISRLKVNKTSKVTLNYFDKEYETPLAIVTVARIDQKESTVYAGTVIRKVDKENFHVVVGIKVIEINNDAQV